MPQRTEFAHYSLFVNIDKLLAARDRAPSIIGRLFGANIKCWFSVLLPSQKEGYRTNTSSTLCGPHSSPIHRGLVANLLQVSKSRGGRRALTLGIS